MSEVGESILQGAYEALTHAKRERAIRLLRELRARHGVVVHLLELLRGAERTRDWNTLSELLKGQEDKFYSTYASLYILLHEKEMSNGEEGVSAEAEGLR